MNIASMTGLQPGKRYFYVYGDEQLGKSQERSFVMGPAAGAESTVRVLATADMVSCHIWPHLLMCNASVAILCVSRKVLSSGNGQGVSQHMGAGACRGGW